MAEPLRAAWPQPDTTDQDKIKSLEDLAVACAEHRAAGRRIVHCHGVFDLLHIGHVRHLQAAKRFGDVLVVTVTADQFVNKGPDRPAFAAELRMEFLSRLDLVDLIATIEAPSALPAIDVVQPASYVKGSEYQDESKDVTGKISVERRQVESHGGALVFTHDVTYSSSGLLNKHFLNQDSVLRSYLETQRDEGIEAELQRIVEAVSQMKIVIVGETIVDRYVYVSPLGKSAKENIVATLRQTEESFAGGVVASACHLAALCPNIELISILGDPDEGETYEDLVRSVLADGISPTFIRRPGGPTVRKTRFVEPTYTRKLFEVYDMADGPLQWEVEAELQDLIVEKARDADMVIVNDFGHGMLSPDTVRLMRKSAKFLAANAQSNAGNLGYNLITRYRGADFVCVAAPEGWLAVQDRHMSLANLAGRHLPELVDCPNVIITHGRGGCYASRGDGHSAHVPAFATSPVDTVGAGDAFFVFAAPAVAASASCETAAFMGSVAGALAVGIVGHRRYLSKLEVLRYISTLLK